VIVQSAKLVEAWEPRSFTLLRAEAAVLETSLPCPATC